jgi:DNA-3-methyladenine glycosylase I
MESLFIADDGLARCGWCVSAPDYIEYHDREWGRPVHGDVALFERITLEAFQSGLSWLTILRKRDNFRAAFAGFDFDAVARFDAGDAERLMNDAGIVRNRRKIEATIVNARAALALQQAHGPGALDALVWSHAPVAGRPRPHAMSDLVPISPESSALSKALKARGFVFVGPTTMHAAMQACGLIDDHLVGCHRAA